MGAETVLSEATDAYRSAFGPRLLATYALGSLAHGGFSSLVSDVDLALIVADRVRPADATEIEAIGEAQKSGGAELSSRLSVFWGTPATLRGDAPGGRFPPLDRLDCGGGLIVNISSLSSILYSPATSDYAASKAALEVMSMTLHLELRGDGIKVTTVPLGAFKTSFWENLSVASSANETTRALWTNAEAAADQSGLRGDPAEAAGGIADVIHAETHSVRRYIGGSSGLVQMWKTMPDDDYVAMIGQWADQVAAAQPTT